MAPVAGRRVFFRRDAGRGGARAAELLARRPEGADGPGGVRATAAPGVGGVEEAAAAAAHDAAAAVHDAAAADLMLPPSCSR